MEKLVIKKAAEGRNGFHVQQVNGNYNSIAIMKHSVSGRTGVIGQINKSGYVNTTNDDAKIALLKNRSAVESFLKKIFKVKVTLSL